MSVSASGAPDERSATEAVRQASATSSPVRDVKRGTGPRAAAISADRTPRGPSVRRRTRPDSPTRRRASPRAATASLPGASARARRESRAAVRASGCRAGEGGEDLWGLVEAQQGETVVGAEGVEDPHELGVGPLEPRPPVRERGVEDDGERHRRSRRAVPGPVLLGERRAGAPRGGRSRRSPAGCPRAVPRGPGPARRAAPRGDCGRRTGAAPARLAPA